MAPGTGWTRQELRLLVAHLSRQEGLNPRLVDAVVWAESGYDPQAVSRKGAMGLMQLMPSTAARLAVTDPFDPEQNARAGVRELSRLVDRYAGDLVLALAAYNAGEGAVSRYGGVPPYPETRGYVASIMTRYTGRSFRLPAAGRRPRVRLVTDAVSGTPLITNVSGGPAAGDRPGATPLAGGFGR